MKTNKQFEPFLKWVEENDDLSEAEVKFIKEYVTYCHQDIVGIWGYLLEFFDSVGLEVFIHGDLSILIYNNNLDSDQKGWETHLSNKKSRQQAQQEAIKKAFEILETFNQ